MGLLFERNEILAWFGAANFGAAVLLLLASYLYPLDVGGANAWFKPIKFTVSTGILSWSLAWYSGYLAAPTELNWVSWILVVSLGVEILYIVLQAGRGQMSHFNLSTPFYAAMFTLMAIGATVATLAVGYMAMLFFSDKVAPLPPHYLWAIRLGLLLFVVFAFQGFAMGSRLSHSLGGPDGSAGWFFLGWSRTLGDLRVAHFVGMHALQVLPLLAWFVLRNLPLTLTAFALYTALAIYTWAIALQGKPLVSG
jgi:hypothetical protein